MSFYYFKKEESIMDSTTIAVDIAKSVFQVAVSHHPGKVSEHYRFSRSRFKSFFVKHQPARVLFEACGSAHYWAREFIELGHEVFLLPPHEVRPYVPRNKTDRTDAKAILEAFRNKDINTVPVKSVDQHTLATLHRFRSSYISQRTARINSTRGILREIGIFIPPGASKVVPTVIDLISDPDSSITDPLRVVLRSACDEIKYFESRTNEIEAQLKRISKDYPVVKRLRSIPGIGLLTATAMVAFIGSANRFPSGRHFASYLGLTPREHSSGSRRHLGCISKKGDKYIRMLLVHGARSVLWSSKKKANLDRLRIWALEIERRRGHNKAAVALANKLARIVWAVWTKNCLYQSKKEVN
jgi:transposase